MKLKRAVLGLLVGLMVGSVAHALPSAQALRQFLDKHYDPKITYYQNDTKTSTSGCREGMAIVMGRDPISNNQRPIKIKQYRPALPAGVTSAPEANKAIIIMPPTGGENLLDQKYANQFCSRGFRVLIVESFLVLEDNGPDLAMYDRSALRSLVAIRQTANFLNATGSNSLGILGTSLGALQASFATVVDPRLNVATFIAGGMGLADIVAASGEPAQAQLREMRMANAKLNQTQYADQIRQAVHIDVLPLVDTAVLSKTKKVLCMVAMNDSYVPTPTQMRLYEAFGRQGVITFEGDHVDSIKRTAIFKSLAIVNFFLQNLK